MKLRSNLVLALGFALVIFAPAHAAESDAPVGQDIKWDTPPPAAPSSGPVGQDIQWDTPPSSGPVGQNIQWDTPPSSGPVGQDSQWNRPRRTGSDPNRAADRQRILQDRGNRAEAFKGRVRALVEQDSEQNSGVRGSRR